MIFANIRNNEIIDFNSKYLDEDIERVETTQEMQNAYEEDKTKVIFKDGEIILNPDWEEQQAQKEREKQRQELLSKLDELDKKRIRAVCEGGENADTKETWVEYYNKQAQELREELNKLNK